LATNYEYWPFASINQTKVGSESKGQYSGELYQKSRVCRFKLTLEQIEQEPQYIRSCKWKQKPHINEVGFRIGIYIVAGVGVGGFYYTAETRDSTTAVWLLLAIIVHKLHIYEGGHMCGR